MEAVLWTGRRGALSHETALDLFELSDVNPSAIHLTVPRAFRTRKDTLTHTASIGTTAAERAHVARGTAHRDAERAILGGIEQALGWQLIDQPSRRRARAGSSGER